MEASGESENEDGKLDEDPEGPEDEEDEPVAYVDMAIYQQADLDRLDGELRRMQALLSGE